MNLAELLMIAAASRLPPPPSGIARIGLSQNSGSTTQWSVPLPPGSGGFIGIRVMSNGPGQGPDGWSELFTDSAYDFGGNSQYLAYYYKQADGSEPSTLSGQYGNNGNFCALAERWSGVATADVIDPASTVTESDSGTHILSTGITTSTDGCMVLLTASIGSYGTPGVVTWPDPPSGWGNEIKSTQSGGANMFSMSKPMPTAGATGLVTINASITGSSAGWGISTIALKPA